MLSIECTTYLIIIINSFFIYKTCVPEAMNIFNGLLAVSKAYSMGIIEGAQEGRVNRYQVTYWPYHRQRRRRRR